MKKTVALIFGGEGYERHISELSAYNLCSMIDKNEYTLLKIGIKENGEWYFYGGDEERIRSGEWSRDSTHLSSTFPAVLQGKSGFLISGRVLSVDCAIPCLHGDLGEDGTVAGALSLAHIPYVGEDVYASAMTADKVYTKLAARSLGIPTADFIISENESAESAKRRAEEAFGYPMFIKPARLGSSIGAHPIYTANDFHSAFCDAREHAKRLMIEELISFEYELECAFINIGAPMVIPDGVISNGGAFYDFEAKYESEAPGEVLLPKAVKDRAAEYTQALASLIGIRRLSRFDFFVTREGRLFFNEVNAFPGMTETSLFPILTEKAGLSRGEFINRLIDSVIS